MPFRLSFTKKYSPYLKAKRFTVRTDHQALVWLNNFKEPEGQVARWQEALAECDVEIIHHPRSQKLNVDALTRIPMRETRSCPRCSPQGVNAITTTVNTCNWAQLQSTDPDTSITYSRQLRCQHKPPKQEMEGYSWAAQTIAAMWGRLRFQDDVIYFRYDDKSPLRLVIPPSELHQSAFALA